MTADFTLAADWLQAAPLRRLFDALAPVGEARVVGGAVRNTLLAEPVCDIDVATDATPDRVARAAAAAGLGVHETGLEHGTLTIVASGRPFEVTTLREDVATDGRRATVRFTTDWAQDASRRDFTMNALYVDRDGNGIDPARGHADCLARRVRFIGDPDRRILEDHLRILRFFRFNAAYAAGPPDPDGLAAARRHRGRLGDLAVERVANELWRTLAAPAAAGVVALMSDGGILNPFLPPPHDLLGFTALAALERSFGRATPVLGLAMLIGRDRGRFEPVAVGLKLSRRERERGVAAIAASHVPPPRSITATRGLIYDLGPEPFADGLLLAAASGTDVPLLAGQLEEARAWQRPRLPVGGDDLLAQGGTPGPELGRRLAALEERWRRSDFTLGRAALLALDREATDVDRPPQL